jgi:hypothetical protein
MKLRRVVLPIDDITNILRDYAGLVGFPQDAKPVKWMLNPQEGRKVMLVVESNELTPEDRPMEEIRFEVKRTFAVPGVTLL